MLEFNSVITSGPRGPRSSRAIPLRRWPGGLFSLGAVVNGRWAASAPLAPWALSASVLIVLGCWDYVAAGGRPDTILLGLAAYEMLIGLTEEPRHA